MNRPHHIILLDDHSVITEGMKLLFADNLLFEIVATFNSGNDLIKKIDDIPFDILMTDLSMPEVCGLTVIKHVHKKYPTKKIIVLSMFNDDVAMHEAYQNGADGFLNKSANKVEIEQVLKQVMEGKKIFPEHIKYEQDFTSTKKIHTLSTRELEILKLVGEGFSSKDIAHKLFLSEFTVNTHRRNMLKKTGASNLAALIKLAQDSRWL